MIDFKKIKKREAVGEDSIENIKEKVRHTPFILKSLHHFILNFKKCKKYPYI